MGEVMNILSYDIEEWYIEKKFNGARQEKYKVYDAYLHHILDLLDEHNIKATFFCVGGIATDFSYVVEEISARGHDIGCHSNEHTWLTKMTQNQLREDTRTAIAALEDCCGQKVVSYRAPAFSIGEDNKWALEILAECGIERDSSLFPAKRDFGGFDGFPTTSPSIVDCNGVKIKELPIILASIMGKQVAYTGGGYFRLFPYRFIAGNMKQNRYNICYFHIGDLIYDQERMMTREEYETYFQENGSYLNRLKRHFKSTVGTKGAFLKMERLIDEFDFVSLAQVDNNIDWSKVDMVKL